MRAGFFKDYKTIFLGGGCAKDILKIGRKSSWEDDARRTF